ncbi:MAG TPA: hypothetical protein VFZ58_02025 [Candidatus Saccharimonadales bacterium]
MRFFRKGRGSEGEIRHQASALRQPHAADPRQAYIFRRSRTLTGSAASDVKTVAPKRTDLQSERLKLHELQRRRRMLVGIVITCSFVALGIWYLLATTVIGAKIVADNQALSPAEQQKIRRSIQEYVESFPTEAFVPTLQRQRFMAFIERSYPEIASIQLKSSWLGVDRSFHITYRQALATWQIGDKRFYIDANGIAFTALHGPEPRLKVEDASGFQPTDGNSVASKRFIRYLGQLLAAVQLKQIGSVERIIIPTSMRELDIYFKDRSYPLKTHIDRDPYKQVDDIAAALTFIDEKQVKPQYVDVRIEGRAYYR